MGHGVVDKDILGVGALGWRISHEVGHAVREGGGACETAGVGVVLHVVLGAMGEDDGGFDLANDARHLAQVLDGVEDLEVIANGGMKGGSENGSRVLALLEADVTGLLRVHFDGSATTRGEIEVVGLKARGLEEKEGARSEVLDVVGVGEDGESSATEFQI